MRAERYTQKQILCGLRIFWREELGCESPFDPDMRIDKQFEAEKDHIDSDRRIRGFPKIYYFSLYIMFRGLQRFFGFTSSWEEWKDFFGLSVRNRDEWEKKVAPRLTFRGLADFIRERMEAIPLEPLVLLGSSCLSAGIFRGIEQLVHQIRPKARGFGPSTPIRDCLRGRRLHVLWSRLRWIVEDQIPPPPALTFDTRHLRHSRYLKLTIGLLLALWQRDLEGLVLGIVSGLTMTHILLLLLGGILEIINSRMNPLPEGIETFGDLARVLAAIIVDQQSEAASCSTP
jgi:hypothetical protein